METKISHPTDTHPTISERYKNIGFDSNDLTSEKLTEVGGASAILFEDAVRFEEELTLLEHRFMHAIGAVTEPEDEGDKTEDDQAFLNAVYSLAAAMVGADGKIVQEEIQIAESIGANLISSFDGVDFRAYCNSLEEIPNFESVVEALGPALNDKGKMAIYSYLKEIAYADDELADEEKDLLVHIRNAWKLEV